MPRTVITTQQAKKNVATNPMTWTAADATNNHFYADSGDTVLLMRNTDSTSKTVTISSVPEPSFARTGDVVVVVPAASGGVPGMAVFGLPDPQAWDQADGTINVNVSNATGLSFCALQVQRR